MPTVGPGGKRNAERTEHLPLPGLQPRLDAAPEASTIVLTRPSRLNHFAAELPDTAASRAGSAEDKSKSTRLLLQSAIDLLASSWRMVESLATPNAGLMNDSPWYPYKPTPGSPPLDVFVSQVLLHTRTDFLTLLLATTYLGAVAAKLPDLVRAERAQLHAQRYDRRSWLKMFPTTGLYL
ncbi:hypothetical protein AURDEDRAFT_165763 [Auricularia subglabra TFB-10046 SS5]|nr:hypothetical protein AURDEDRAFT_165763 [Auricularia subglabra TFB-10046 SS5]